MRDSECHSRRVPSPRPLRTILVLAASGGLLPGCGPAEPGSSSREATGEVVVLEAPRLGPSAPDTSGEGWRRHRDILSVSDVARVRDRWLILDHRSPAIHLLDPGLGRVRSFGGSGEGPGELSRPVRLAVSADTVIGVLDLMGRRLDLFDPGGNFVERLGLEPPGCLLGLSGALHPDPSGLFVVDGVCLTADGPAWTVARVARDGSMDVVERRFLRAGGAIRLPLGLGAFAWRDALWIGGPDGCFTAVEDDPRSSGPPRVCMPESPPVPLPDSVGRRLAGAGTDPRLPSVEIPEDYPPFLTARSSAGGPVLELPRPDGTVHALLEDDGSLLLLPRGTDVWPAPGSLLITRTLLEGTGMQTIPR